MTSAPLESKHDSPTVSPPSSGPPPPSPTQATPPLDPSDPPPRSRKRLTLLTLALCLAVFLAALDTIIITTALPTIVADFHTSGSGFAWIGSAYLLGQAASIPFWGKLSDIFGRKPVLLIANVVFFVGSVLSGVSGNLKVLIAGRAVQGLGGGGLVVLANIVISDLVSLRERGLYFAMIGSTWALASAIGPVIGGAFTERVSWRWCFYLNLPCDVIAFIILLIFLDVHTPKTPLIAGLKAIDWLGASTVTAATLLFLLGLGFGGVGFPWSSATVLCLIILGIILFVFFFLSQWKLAKYPVMPLALFSKRSNAATLIVCFCHGFILISVAYFIPLYFQQVLGASPLRSGIWTLAFCLAMSVFTICTGIFVRKTGRYLEVIIFGFLFSTLGFGLFISFPAHISWSRIIIFQMIAAIGIGPNFLAPLIALQTKVAPKDIATATSTLSFARTTAGAMSVAIGQVVFQNEMQEHISSLLAAGIPSGLAISIAKGAAVSSTSVIAALPPAQRMLVHEATADSLSKMWVLFTCVSALGLLASLGIGRQELSRQHVEHRTGLTPENRDMIEQQQEKALQIPKEGV